MEELDFDGKKYLSSKRAAEITGYAKDYVGQLCREGRVVARLVGRAWYVSEESIKDHRFGEKQEEDSIEKTANTPLHTVQKEEVATTWGTSVYAAEAVETVPILRERPVTEKSHYIPKTSTHASPVHSMQSVWQEWFDNNAQEESKTTAYDDKDLLETEPGSENEIEIREVATEVPLQRIQREERRPRATDRGSRSVARKHRSSNAGDIVIRSSLLAIALLVASLTFFALGFGPTISLFAESPLGNLILGVTK